MLQQFKNVERKQVKSPITTPKPKQVIELSKDLDKMVAEPMEELDIEALLAGPIEFIREDEYSENLLDDLLNHHDLLDVFQDDPLKQLLLKLFLQSLLIKLVISSTWREM